MLKGRSGAPKQQLDRYPGMLHSSVIVPGMSRVMCRSAILLCLAMTGCTDVEPGESSPAIVNAARQEPLGKLTESFLLAAQTEAAPVSASIAAIRGAAAEPTPPANAPSETPTDADASEDADALNETPTDADASEDEATPAENTDSETPTDSDDAADAEATAAEATDAAAEATDIEVADDDAEAPADPESATEPESSEAATESESTEETLTKTESTAAQVTKTPTKPKPKPKAKPKAKPKVSGALVWSKKCKGCHGASGDGKGKINSFKTPGWRGKWTTSKIKRIVTNGKPGTKMKAFKGKLTPEEIAAVSSYARSLGR